MRALERRRGRLACVRCRLRRGGRRYVRGGEPDADLCSSARRRVPREKQGFPSWRGGQLLNRCSPSAGSNATRSTSTRLLAAPVTGIRPDELEACRPWLDERIVIIDPAVIVTLGNWATRYILGSNVSISRVRGQRFPWNGRIVIPTFHPAAVLHGGGENSRQMAALRMDFQEMKRALAERPQPVEEQLGLF